jgi:hypothetical protein
MLLLFLLLLAVPSQQELQTQADSYLYLFDEMPSVQVEIKDEPLTTIIWGEREKELIKARQTVPLRTVTSLAYCSYSSAVIDGKRSYFDIKIVVKQKYLEAPDNYGLTIEHVLKHELIHAWLARKGIGEDHGPEFWAKAQEIGLEQVKKAVPRSAPVAPQSQSIQGADNPTNTLEDVAVIFLFIVGVVTGFIYAAYWVLEILDAIWRRR